MVISPHNTHAYFACVNCQELANECLRFGSRNREAVAESLLSDQHDQRLSNIFRRRLDDVGTCGKYCRVSLWKSSHLLLSANVVPGYSRVRSSEWLPPIDVELRLLYVRGTRPFRFFSSRFFQLFVFFVAVGKSRVVVAIDRHDNAFSDGSPATRLHYLCNRGIIGMWRRYCGFPS